MAELNEQKTTRSITLPVYLWERLKELAAENDRNINGELAATLKRALGFVDA